MSKTIHKFVVPFDGYISMDPNAQLLHVGHQGGDVMIWVIVDPEAPKVTRHFQIIGTGFSVPENSDYLGTVQIMPSGLVWHVFLVG